MQQRDFIKDEIERLGRVLGKLVVMLLGTEGGDLNPQQRILTAQQKLKAEGDLDPKELVRLSREDLIKKLDQLNLEPLHLDQLAEFLAVWAGEEGDPEIKKILYQRALLLYDLAGERSGTYSMVRADREAIINDCLGRY
jgi:hypothetical protein